MLTVCLTLYLLLATFGAWAGHSGFGAFCVFVVWVVAVVYAVILAFCAPWWPSKLASMAVGQVFGKEVGRVVLNIADVIDLLVNKCGFIVPSIIVAFVATLLYFLGWIDGIASSLSAHTGWIGMTIAIGYLLLETWSLLDRFFITDEIKPAVTKMAGSAKKLTLDASDRAVDLWNDNYPIVKDKSLHFWNKMSKERVVFCKLCRSICRYCRLRIDVYRHSRDLVANVGTEKQQDISENLLAARRSLEENKLAIVKLWLYCWCFVLLVGGIIMFLIWCLT